MTAANLIENNVLGAGDAFLEERDDFVIQRNKYTNRVGDDRVYFTLHRIKAVKRWPWSKPVKKNGPNLIPKYSFIGATHESVLTFLQELILYKNNYYFVVTRYDWFD